MPKSKERLHRQKPKTRQATIFDACAGRVSGRGKLVRDVREDQNTRSGRKIRLAPEEALLKRYCAPDGLESSALYFSGTSDLRPDLIPDSELLRAIHHYTTHLFKGLGAGESDPCWGAFDGTAMLALGVLVEETVRELVGDSGDLAFVGGVEIKKGESHDQMEEKLDIETVIGPKSTERKQGGRWEDGIFIVPE
ncbi:hypothetical protein P152DRAFT_471302 [Eremomyces bilateralis CBS 781.70]|uniref:Uncharacterized protein n=1 Tax=Eremomyces bilateralis CBS 781.70 TaxID=1392243 RepID=A0A6G1GDI4_9PEZI|nr:uncharacterized protein P152DRAFT_471302 [Eremomyces bilateralis CBS 781.70]KAF1815929.1 hypothetical protein P152DRAFT_471302 [Eremomyces bilateralis CBS 781.70]